MVIAIFRHACFYIQNNNYLLPDTCGCVGGESVVIGVMVQVTDAVSGAIIMQKRRK